MSDTKNAVSEAIVLFLGFGRAPSPSRDRDRLFEEFGGVEGTRLDRVVNSLLKEVGAIEVDWSVHSLETAGHFAREEMRRRHPGLSEAALRAIEWKFTYDWR
jgi:hypothetical protein